MTEVRSYPPGTPNWVDLSSPNVEVSASFYRDLFGWETVDAAPEGRDAGGYRMFELRDRFVAGLGPLQDGGGAPAWTTYIASADAAATAAAIRDGGGTVLMDPFPIFDAGHSVMATDPSGATFNVWQAGAHPGAGLVDEPGTLSWNELNTRDPDTAFAFYGEVFGWDVRTHDTGAGPAYAEFLLDGRPVAGGLDMGDRVPDAVPPHWLTYFSVDDTDATVARVEELGGDVLVPSTDIEPGRFAVVADDVGAFFAVISPPRPARGAARGD